MTSLQNKNKINISYDELPREIDPGSHVVLVLDDLNAGARLEHHHHVALVQDVAGGVDLKGKIG